MQCLLTLEIAHGDIWLTFLLMLLIAAFSHQVWNCLLLSSSMKSLILDTEAINCEFFVPFVLMQYIYIYWVWILTFCLGHLCFMQIVAFYDWHLICLFCYQLIAVRKIPWAKANINHTGQALIVSAGTIRTCIILSAS